MESNTVLSFEEDAPRQPDQEPDDALVISVDGYEGPIDLLLTMARDQKVDLRQISILALAEQYLVFVERARKLRIELAADYLVMAAWLAYLKSKLLLPGKPGEVEEELSGEALAEALAFQLQRLEAMQNIAKELFARPRLGQSRLSVGLAGLKDQAPVKIKWKADLYQILDAYGSITKRMNPTSYDIKTWPLMSMEDATQRLANMIGFLAPGQWKTLWQALDEFMPDDTDINLNTRSAMASTLTAALELVKQDKIDLQQEGLYAPIMIRTKPITTINTPTTEAANDA
jgi:segregation and condensation protein A